MRRRLTQVLILAMIVVLGAPAVGFLTSACRQPSASSWLFVADLAALPPDGTPRRFSVRTLDIDAWTQREDKVVGTAFVRRVPGQDRVVALHPDHGMLKIYVAFDEAANVFRSCCWRVSFDLDGEEIREVGRLVSGDRMEELPVRVDSGRVYVQWAPTE